MSDRQAVITGLGAVTPSGATVDDLWDAVAHGRSAIDVLEGEEFENLPVRIGGQIRGFDGDGMLSPALARRLSPVQHWAIAAADQALRQARVERGSEAAGNASALPWDPQRVAVIAATGSGPVDAMQQATRALDQRGPRAVPLSLAMHGAPDSVAALLSQRYGITGPAHGISATCASGAIGLGEALRRIRHGYADAVLVVGLEDCLNAVNLSSNANLRALATGGEAAPAEASRPFDRQRTGFVMSHGAAAILLESADTARARGADALAVLAGFGESSDAHHATAPHPQGRGAAQAMAASLRDAGIEREAVDHVNAHGTGTPAGDAAEAAALRAVFAEQLRAVPLTATKSSTGHLLGASGVVEAIIAVQTLRHGILPPTINLHATEFDDLDIVTAPREALVHTVLSNSFGFGGHNGALLFTRATAETAAFDAGSPALSDPASPDHDQPPREENR